MMLFFIVFIILIGSVSSDCSNKLLPSDYVRPVMTNLSSIPNVGQWVIIKDLKLAFCVIPKVASTQLYTLFGKMEYNTKWFVGPNEINNIRNKITRLKDLRPEKQLGVFNDAAWTRAVMIRDPSERTLSAFLDKVKNSTDNQGAARRYAFNLNMLQSSSLKNITYDTFISLVERGSRNLNCASVVNSRVCSLNEHWAPQSRFCGLTHLIPYVTNVLTLDTSQHSDLHNSLQCLLGSIQSRVGGKASSADKLQLYKKFLQIMKNGEKSKKSTGRRHATHSTQQLSVYYTPELFARTKALYDSDYKLFGLK